jgi:hypothetical protein
MDNMNDVKQKLKELRPSLRKVAPLTWSVILGFGIMNIVLGVSLMSYPLGTPIAIVTRFTPMAFFGAVFLILGTLMLFKLWQNDWRWLRGLLLAGLLIKTIWTFALLIRLFQGGNAIILCLWLFITHVQASTYIHFIPINTGKKNGWNR